MSNLADLAGLGPLGSPDGLHGRKGIRLSGRLMPTLLHGRGWEAAAKVTQACTCKNGSGV